MVLVSAGFDGHRDDPLAELDLLAEDFAWVTHLITTAAADAARGRVISLLEGGYDLQAIEASVAASTRALTGEAPVALPEEEPRPAERSAIAATLAAHQG